MVKYLVVVLLLVSKNVISQNRFLNLYGGESHYSGDLGNDKIPKLIYPAYGIGISVELNERMIINANLYNGKIGGNDKYNAKTKSRNLSFYSDLTEFSLQFQYNLFDLYEYKVTPHFFTGLAIFNYSPYTKTESGNVVYLQKLKTEGQGFYNGRKAYKTTQLSIPFGAGITWALNANKRISIFGGVRKTFTDYLDDVSKTYIDANTLLAKAGNDAVVLAFREDEINPTATYPTDGTQRGNPKNKDLYFFSGLSFQFRIMPPKRRHDKSARFKKGNTACPRVY
jgi:hypothetical protein